VTDGQEMPLYLAELSTTGLRDALAAAKRPVALWPVGSTEPHGPHLPLATDIILSEENARRAAIALRELHVEAFVAPALPYGVTDFAAGFSGALTVPEAALVALIGGVVASLLGDGFHHVCLINHHLEPGQLSALSAAHAQCAARHGGHAVSLPKVISRRWGGRLGAEFRSGACHAGEYEGSLVLAASPHLVDIERALGLPEVPISLSAAIGAGEHTFMAAGADQAYTGRPADATVEEGERLYGVLTEMVVTEVLEHLEESQ
jgi:creatinine amidohydrolase